VTGAASNAVFAADLRKSSSSTVEIRSANTINNYGERTYTGTPVEYPCHVQAVTTQPLGVNLDEVVEYVVYIPVTDLVIDTDAEMKLPAPINDTRPIVRIVDRTDATGPCGTTIYVGRRTN
jgi:hypothetical protein